MQFGRHGLQLRTVEHAHDGGLDHIVEVMPQRDLVAAQLLGLAVQVAAAHPGAEVEGFLSVLLATEKMLLSKMVTGMCSSSALDSIFGD